MEVRITSDERCLTPLLLEHIERRLNFSFSGIRNNVLLVHIRVRDLNGPRGGNDKLCQMLVTIPGCPDVVIKQIHGDIDTAIDRAVQRAAYQAERLLLKKHKTARRRRFFFPDMQPAVSAV